MKRRETILDQALRMAMSWRVTKGSAELLQVTAIVIEYVPFSSDR